MHLAHGQGKIVFKYIDTDILQPGLHALVQIAHAAVVQITICHEAYLLLLQDVLGMYFKLDVYVLLLANTSVVVCEYS